MAKHRITGRLHYYSSPNDLPEFIWGAIALGVSLALFIGPILLHDAGLIPEWLAVLVSRWLLWPLVLPLWFTALTIDSSGRTYWQRRTPLRPGVRE